LTGKSSVEDRVTGLDAGADDYLPKPFSMKELSARVRALLRRPEPMVSELVQLGPLQIDLKFHKVMRGHEEVNLLAKEISLLEFLVRHRGQVFSVDDLLNKVWHSESDSSEDAVRQCVTRLRRKIDGDGEDSLIITVKGLGYKVV
ncbi:MAG: response regulator transcription factor, partial [Candidatus Competibacteraceae bacterium]|nr:response regulator transcription factor [Candidatus Competibacteraceae bacterium]